MSLNMKEAKVLLILDGLGMMKFNELNKECELTFIHEESHSFEIRFWESTDSKDTRKEFKVDGMPEYYTESSLYPLFGKNKFGSNELKEVNVEIVGKGKSSVLGVSKYLGENFDRTKIESDKFDYRWTVNIDELHNDNLRLKPKSERSQFATSKLTITNAEFFTYRRAKYFFNKKLDSTLIPNTGNESEEFGAVGAELGVKFDSETVVFRIEKNGEIHSTEISNYEGELPKIIEITNAGKGDGSDLPFYYKFFDIEDHNKIELVKNKEKGPIVKDDFCHLIEYGG